MTYRFHRLHRRVGIAAAGVVLLGPVLLGAGLRPHRVSAIGDPFEPNATDLAEVSPDGEWIVWIQSGISPPLLRLYASKRWEGSEPVPLTPQILGWFLRDFEISSDSRWVVFAGAAEGGSRIELWTVPIGGGSQPHRLSPASGSDPLLGEYRISPIGPRVVFEGEFDTPGKRGVWSATVDGSAPAIRLSPDPVANGEVLAGFALSPEGSRVLFVGDLEVDGGDDLWSAGVDGSTPALRLNASPLSTRAVDPGSLVLATDGSRVLYQEAESGSENLWSVPVDASELPVLLTTPSGTWRIIGNPVADPTNARALFVGWDASGIRRLWSASLAGPAAATVALTGAGWFPDLEAVFDAGGSHAVFVAELATPNEEEVWSVPLDASGPPIRVSPLIEHSDGTRARIFAVPGRSRAVFSVDAQQASRSDPWSVPVDASSPAVRLDTWGPDGTAGEIRVVADGSRVVVRDQSTFDGTAVLWSVLADGTGSPVQLSLDPVPGAGTLSGFLEVDPSGHRALYLGDLVELGRLEAWSAPVGGPAGASERIHPDPAGPDSFLGHLSFAPDGEGSLFRGDFGNPDGTDLWISDGMVFRADFEEGDASEWSASVP